MKVAAEGAGSRQGSLWARRMLAIAAVFLLGLTASACNFDLGGEAKYPVPRQKGQNQPQYEEEPGVFGEGGIFGPDLPEDSTGGGIGVNNLLWRASLDTVSFMPLVSADPFGGVIITDWYTPPSAPDERFKVNRTRPPGRWHPCLGVPPTDAGRRLGRRPSRAQHRDRPGERHPDPRPPNASVGLPVRAGLQ